jgi:selenide, water dikinase
VRRLERGSADCQPDRDIDFDAAILATHASAAAWLRQTGLALDDGGFIRVDGTLRSLSHPSVFAAGDIAAVEGHVLAKAGVYAVRQGPVLAANLRAILARDRLRAYRPQRRALALISTGDRQAIASYGPLAWQGAWVWQLKDWIDHRWIRRYQMLPA